MVLRKVILLMSLTLTCAGVQAVEDRYQASLDESKWEMTANSALLCQAEHAIPQFGVAVYSQQAGRKLRLELITMHSIEKGTPVELRAETAIWKTMKVGAPVVKLIAGDQPNLIQISALDAERSYHQLREGMQPTFVFKRVNPLVSVLSTVRFRDIDGDFTACVNQLNPKNFEDIRLSHIHFESDDEFPRLQEESSAFSDMFGYLEVDENISEIVVSGHADKNGETCYNDKLSERRAWYVYDLLLARGADPAKLRIAYFGESIPAAKAMHKDTFVSSRRVTVELRRN
ncbi:MAG: outer membrane protein OmpA-like peptidoglycan-associated protein [Planctomycetota bacterium]|jgi:outer membrane protein OmpA-like peptidoglycan-associated protein